MPKTDEIIAVLCSDIHLSHLPPLIRAAEPNWYQAMYRPLEQISELASRCNCPVVCAGDIFDRWNAPPELINFALNNLPEMLAIPGQHDLPNHNHEEKFRSAYETLELATQIVNLPANEPIRIGGCCLYGVPWGHQIHPINQTDTNQLHVAIVHAYCWDRGYEYPGAPTESYLGNWNRKLKTYDAAAFGDNHKGFISDKILNCGTLMRRAADEIHYKPGVGLLHASGRIMRHYLNCGDDKFIDETRNIAELKHVTGLDLSLFVDELRELAPDSLDFRDAVRRVCADNKVANPVQKIILGILDAAGRI